jgi:hypothetical protein
LSIGSVGSILSIGSAGSILSIGSAGGILSIGGAGSSPRTDREEPEPEEAFGSVKDRNPPACYTRILARGQLHLEHSGRRIGAACPADTTQGR